MTAIRKTHVRKPMLLICAVALVAPGCGGDDFENEPRAAVPVELSGVIKPSRVILSPDGVGAGPVRITISNQTDRAHTVILQGNAVEERVGPVYPRDTATIQKTLEPGGYELRAQAEEATTRPVAPADLRIGPRRPESNDRLLLP
ncbi:MAG: hypothetical protein M3131_10925 [Actinomycetota bacterium]|nr:hypothetical protein [Actinomycetota bacterium]